MSNANAARAATGTAAPDPRSDTVNRLVAAVMAPPFALPDTPAARFVLRAALGEAFEAGVTAGAAGEAAPIDAGTRLALVRVFLEGLADVARGDRANFATVSLESITRVLRVALGRPT